MNAVTKTENQSPAAAFRDQLTRQEGEIATALPPHMPVERFMRVVLTAVNGNPDLLAADRRSLFEGAMKAAQDGLLPDGRDGALVIFRAKVDGEWVKKVQWMPMVGGILKKVRNSGELLTISAYVAYENDEFEYTLGDEESITHKPCLDEDRGKPRLVYAVAKTKDGGVYREIMTFKEVEKVRNVSRAKDNGPWKDWWDEMAKKTVIRRLAKRLPMSSDLDDLIRRDDDLYDFQGKRADMDGMHRQFAPTVAERLQQATAAPQIDHQPREGFDPSHVARETETRSTAREADNTIEDTASDQSPSETVTDAHDAAAEEDGEEMTSEPSFTNTESASEPPTQTADDEGGEVAPPTSSPSPSLDFEDEITDAERDRLIAFAKSILPLAAKKDVKPATIEKVEETFRPEQEKFGDRAKASVKTISKAARAIFNGKTSIDSAGSYFADMLGIEPEELTGAAS